MSSVKKYFFREGLIITYYAFFLLLFLGVLIFPLSSDFSIIYNPEANNYGIFLNTLCYFSYWGFSLLGYGYYMLLLVLVIILLRPLGQNYFYKKKIFIKNKRKNIFFILCLSLIFILTPIVLIGIKGETQYIEHFRSYGLVGQFFIMFFNLKYNMSYNLGLIVLTFSFMLLCFIDYYSWFRVLLRSEQSLEFQEEVLEIETNSIEASHEKANNIDHSISNESAPSLFTEKVTLQEELVEIEKEESFVVNDEDISQDIDNTEHNESDSQENFNEQEPIIKDNEEGFILKKDEEEPHLEQSYILPKTSLLNKIIVQIGNKKTFILDEQQRALQEALHSFKVRATCIDYISGPRVTLFRVLPEAGQTVSRFNTLEADLARTLKATSIRILSPISGDDKVGIEIPNEKSSIVSFSSMVASSEWKKQKKEDIPIVLGNDVVGNKRFMSLADAPHLLIAGSTGAGKSIFINTLILSLLYRYNPDELKLILIDPKQVELSFFANLPHLLSPILKNPEKVPSSLGWAVYEMNKRYSQLEKVGVKKLVEYNQIIEKEKRLPFIIIIIDELADLMMSIGKNIEPMIAQIAQKARAVGIHLILATQRPSTDVLTGTIKNNFPTRIAFKVTSYTDSMTILNQKGAEKLLGKGDMLFLKNDCMRVQASLVENEEVRKVVDFCAEQADPNFISIKSPKDSAEEKMVEAYGQKDFSKLSTEDLFEASIDILKELKSNGLEKKLSVSYMQRRMRIGYNKSADLIESLETRGVIGPADVKGKREIFLSNDE